jgi:hypothetical protein
MNSQNAKVTGGSYRLVLLVFVKESLPRASHHPRERNHQLGSLIDASGTLGGTGLMRIGRIAPLCSDAVMRQQKWHSEELDTLSPSWELLGQNDCLSCRTDQTTNEKK